MAISFALNGSDIVQGDAIQDIKVVGGSASKLSLDSYFEFVRPSNAGTVVAFDTNIAKGEDVFFVELFDAQESSTVNGDKAISASVTTKNFLKYVNAGAYNNSLIHRSIPDFVIQGGGFKAPQLPADQQGSDPRPIASGDAIINEPGNSNLRGTIAMAKLGGDPDSATNQFFFNLNDANSSNLDFQNGGFAVFGKVLGLGMEVVDMIGVASTYDASRYYNNGALTDLPLWSLPDDDILRPDNFVSFEDVYVVPEKDLASELIEYSGFSSNAKRLKVSFNASDLELTPAAGATGVVEVTVTARSRLSGAVLKDVFSVDLGGELDRPRRTVVGSLDAIKQQKKLKTFEIARRIKLGSQRLNKAIVGTRKKDKVFGSSRGEILVGFNGKDILKGRGGADGFLFAEPMRFGKKWADKIIDFDSREGDMILVDKKAFGLGNKVSFSRVNAKRLLPNAAKTNANFVYEQKTGSLYFNENGRKPGWGEGGLFVQLQGGPNLFDDDFLIV